MKMLAQRVLAAKGFGTAEDFFKRIKTINQLDHTKKARDAKASGSIVLPKLDRNLKPIDLGDPYVKPDEKKETKPQVAEFVVQVTQPADAQVELAAKGINVSIHAEDEIGFTKAEAEGVVDWLLVDGGFEEEDFMHIYPEIWAAANDLLMIDLSDEDLVHEWIQQGFDVDVIGEGDVIAFPKSKVQYVVDWLIDNDGWDDEDFHNYPDVQKELTAISKPA